MDKFIIRKSKNHESSSSREKEKIASIEKESVASDDDIVGDPGLRKPIDSYPQEIRDSLRRSNKSGGNAFIEIGFNNWKDGKHAFVAHEGSPGSSHSYCRIKVEQYRNQRENVDYLLSNKSVAMEDDYRTRLTRVVRVARYLLMKGLTFRGHDESPESIHRGHFLELINWFWKGNTDVDKVMQRNAPKNNQMTSPKIQRDIIESCAMETRKIIFNEIGDKKFALLVNEARDCSVKEQMSLVLRFVNDKGEVMERFLGLVHVTETSAKSLKKAIDEFFAKHGLSLARLRGQGYDGASNMRGEFNGLKTLILNENKNAHYIHCFAHQLQLVVMSAAQEKDNVCDFFEILSMIVNTVGASCKRKDSLRELHHQEILNKIEMGEISTGRGQNQEISLSRPGDTRWGSHYKTLLRLFAMWNSVGEVLLLIHNDGENSKSRASSGGLLDKMDSFEFVFIGIFMMKILGMTNTLSKVLQVRDQNIGCALNMINVVKNNLQAHREDSWDNLLKEVIEFCEGHQINVPNMEDFVHGRSRKKFKGGEPMTYFHHFCAEIFIKVIDIVAMEIDKHFTESNTNLLRCVMCLDPSNSFANFDHGRLLQLAKLYSDDFSCTDRIELSHEL